MGYSDDYRHQSFGVGETAISENDLLIGGDTVITFSDSATLTLQGVQIADLHADDFIFENDGGGANTAANANSVVDTTNEDAGLYNR